MVNFGLKNDLRSLLLSEDLKTCTVFEFLIFSPEWNSRSSHLYGQRHSGQVPCGILAAANHGSGECCNCECLISFGP